MRYKRNDRPAVCDLMLCDNREQMIEIGGERVVEEEFAESVDRFATELEIVVGEKPRGHPAQIVVAARMIRIDAHDHVEAEMSS